MELILLLIVLLFILGFFALAGWLVWAAARWIFKPDPPLVITDRVDDLAVFERQLRRFYTEGKISDEIYEHIMARIRAERSPLPQAAPASKPARPPAAKPEPAQKPVTPPPAPVVVEEVVVQSVSSVFIEIEPERPSEQIPPPPTTRPAPPPKVRRPFSEVLNSFMEESNIRWGEIIGGLLIIGCSTALVVSLWAQISQIPVLKFLIFTTVTAVLFGIGLYTEHRWKLPTTSRGILTIATLLVPLNFLAIAAVSASNTPGSLVIGSELVAPAVFLCLVYFAGRVITPGCAHILSAGVLGSSIGQLLVRHFAGPDSSPALLISLAAFPVVCYVVTVGFALRLVLADREIDERETPTVFTILGAMSFAALLPFGLLLYKAGPLPMTMMYLAPIVTLWGLPLLATGTVLWRQIKNRELVASRTTGTALGILGVIIVLAGMLLAWPNPASIVPAAILNFAIFTALAMALELPVAHLIAANCLALAYLVAFHVSAGHLAWRNLRVVSLLDVTLSISSGQALAGAVVVFIIAAEWLTTKKRTGDSRYYLIAAYFVAVVSLTLIAFFGVWTAENHWLWIVLGIYSLGAFWVAWRQTRPEFTYVGSVLLLFALADAFSRTIGSSFPWQTALLAHATLCTALAIITARLKVSVLSRPLNDGAFITLVFGVMALFQANTWEVTAMQAQRVFWITAILLLMLWLNRRRAVFETFQIALICATVLTVKAALQQFEWYAYMPLAFMRPSALQIYGTVLTLLCLAFVGLRFLVRRALPTEGATAQNGWLSDAARLLRPDYSIDRMLSWLLLGAFLLLASYGSFSGLMLEFGSGTSSYPPFNFAGFPHQEALAIGSWIVLGLLTVVMVANYYERRERYYLLGASLAVFAAIPLIAGRFEHQLVTATVWRWLAAFFLLGGSILLWYRRDESKQARLFLITLTVVPLLLWTIYPVYQQLGSLEMPFHGSFSGIFAWVGDDVLYGGPLVIVALVMIGYALRGRIPQYAIYGGLFINATVSLVLFIAAIAARGALDRVFLIRLAQLNAITFAVYVLPWLSTRRLWLSRLEQQRQKLADDLSDVQVGLALSLNAYLILSVAFGFIIEPEPVNSAVIAGGGLLGWLALVTTVVATAWLTRARERVMPAWLLAGGLMGASCLVGFGVARSGGWLGMRVLTVCMTASAWVVLLAADRDLRWQKRCRQFAAGFGALAAFLSLWIAPQQDASGWWSVGPLLALTALFASLHWQTFHRRHLYAAGALFNLAASVACFLILPRDFANWGFFAVNIIAGSLASIVWVWLELRSHGLREYEPARTTMLSFHHLNALGWSLLLAFIVLVSVALQPALSPLSVMPKLHWLAMASVLALMFATLWDKHAKYAVAGLYLLGLLAGAMMLYHLQPPELSWYVTLLLATYALVAAVIWRRRADLLTLAGRFGIPLRIEPTATELTWLSVFTILAIATVTVLAYWLVLDLPGFGLRAGAALAVVAQVVTLSLLAEGVWQQRWRQTAVAVFVVGLTLFGWSWLTPVISGTWLNRSVILMLLMFGLTAVYGLLLEQAKAYSADWSDAAKSAVPMLIGAGVLALFFCLGTEIFYQINFGAVRIHPVPLTTIGVTLIAAVVIPVLFALSPQHDPLSLSERGRMNYVYAAEVMLALLFLHIRLTLPWLFTGFIERYWPLAVMVIAYLGVVTSESLRRRKLLVLAQPLERTGVFLPLLPVLGFWLASSDVDFSLLLFVVGGLYGLLSVLRRSFVFGMMAAVAGNAALWYMLHRTDNYQFLQHPQLWLIPVALSVLLAAYLNEDNLTEDQMAGVRYLSLVTIYVSSTADIFINGVANSPWLPLILGSFSLAGVFAGIIFRIRGLLLLGSVFLLLSIITMIWYASANLGWTWLWYVAGIVTGATIIFMFAVFEKKRSEVLRLVEGLKEWER